MNNKFLKYKFWELLILEASQDDVGIWEIIYKLSFAFPQSNEDERKVMTLEIVREYLENGLMELGDFECNNEKGYEFKLWNLDIDSAIDRIDTEWSQLGTEPSVGDIAFLITTEKGDREADKILQRKNEDSQ
ncbi:hypothetical protein [Roseofilum sp. Guam]|uniref:hypothetical protein n=1 Tax=Roseofilum sp. Guam TaxID=2821502 RepID=UPI001B1EAFE2|nr:hypothetical protein [Roseofilum sp. Guam]MBP0030535.1 hypothetical protein [Roseofilum sp. Guam]